jgi:hypothetical protein
MFFGGVHDAQAFRPIFVPPAKFEAVFGKERLVTLERMAAKLVGEARRGFVRFIRALEVALAPPVSREPDPVPPRVDLRPRLAFFRALDAQLLSPPKTWRAFTMSINRALKRFRRSLPKGDAAERALRLGYGPLRKAASVLGNLRLTPPKGAWFARPPTPAAPATQPPSGLRTDD